MNWQEREELEAEWNAQFDYVREAFGPSVPDPWMELYDDWDWDEERHWALMLERAEQDSGDKR